MPMMSEKPKRQPVVLFLIATALAVRLTLLALLPGVLSLKTSGYDAYAANLVEGRGYTRFADRPGDTDLPPLYPFFLAGVYIAMGRGPIQVALVQSAVATVSILLIYRIGRRVAGETVGLLSGGFVAFYPYLLFQDLTVNDTALFLFLLTAAVWASYRTYDTQSKGHAAATGAVLGLAALTKPFVVLIAGLLAIWWIHRLRQREGLRLAVLSGLGMIAVLAPWVIRNSLLDGELVFISTNGGSNFHQGNNDCVVDYLSRGWDAQWVDCLPPQPTGLSEAALDRWHLQRGLEYLRRNPDQWLRLLATKFRVLWNPALMPVTVPPGAAAPDDPVWLYETPAFQTARRVHLAYFGTLLVFGGVGMFIAARRHMDVLPLGMVLAAVTLTYLVFHPSTRYRAPADPFLFVFSAIAAEKLRTYLPSRGRVSGSA